MYKVTICGHGWALHFASREAPAMRYDITGRLVAPNWDPILGTEDGDTPGYVDWGAVVAVSWREVPSSGLPPRAAAAVNAVQARTLALANRVLAYLRAAHPAAKTARAIAGDLREDGGAARTRINAALAMLVGAGWVVFTATPGTRSRGVYTLAAHAPERVAFDDAGELAPL